MTYGKGEIELRISDDGRGAAAPRLAGGHGLIGMRERAAMYGGSVEAAPRPGGGFRVVARIPLGVAA
jgi:signal transduction histidine kinase